MKKAINIIGAGLAGSEAAYYLIQHGFEVNLFEQRPLKNTGAHHTSLFGELVCSNSLKSNSLENACGLLKEEMRHMHSLTMQMAELTRVPSGNALSVDRAMFAQMITDKLLASPHVHFFNEEITTLPDGITILATGPLTSAPIVEQLEQLTQEKMFAFFDACSPIIEKDSIDFKKAYFKSRYEQGDDSYINCAFTKEEYDIFYHELVNAETAPVSSLDTNYFEGCMPIEVMARRGEKTMRYGPMKPMGLRRSPEDRPFAVIQLRQDNVAGNLYNMVGFQTNLTYKEQQRVFALIPGLENARYVRYGLMHRNTYICAPKFLNADLSMKARPEIIIAGQLSGVEGYVESAASGLVAGIVAAKMSDNLPVEMPPVTTMLGSLLNYLHICSPKHFSPMNANYGILYGVSRDRLASAEIALKAIDEWWRRIHE